MVFVLVTGSVAAGADSEIGEARRERDEARAAQAEAAAQLELLGAQDDQIAAALDDMIAAVEHQRARVDAAQQALVAAEAEVARQQDRLVVVQAAIEQARADARERAVESFLGVAVDDTELWLGEGDPNVSARKVEYLRATSGTQEDAFDRLRAIEALQTEVIGAADTARQQADDLRVQIETDLAVLEERLRVQESIRAELQRRIDEWQARAAEAEAAEAQATEDILRIQTERLGSRSIPLGPESYQGFVLPASGGVGSGFGMRVHPIFRTSRMHSGVDIGGAMGNPVVAAKAGEVISAGWRGGYGNCVIIDHGGGVATLYAHLSEIDVGVGDRVGQREVIGLVGSTGWSTGPHLHFEVRVNGAPEDPLLFLP